MEEIKILLSDNMHEYEKLKEKFALNPNLKLKCIKYSQTFEQEFIVHNDEKIRYYQAVYMVCFSNNFVPYLKKIRSHYLCFNKKTKKLTLIRLEPCSIFRIITQISKLLNINWFTEYYKQDTYEGIDPSHFCTKSVLEKVWGDKITNPEVLLKYYTKNILKLNNITWKSVRAFYKHRVIWGNPDHLLKIIDVYVENPNLFIAKLVELCKINKLADNAEYADYLQQIAALGIKSRIAYWSEKRFMEEHNNLSIKLMEYELQDKESTPIFSNSFNEELPKDINCRFINSEIECFKEAQFMHNCVYTNYWNSISNLNYFAISIDDKIFGRALAGIRRYTNNDKVIYELDQIRGIRNTLCNTNLENFMKEWVNNNQTLFSNIYATKVNDICNTKSIELSDIRFFD